MYEIFDGKQEINNAVARIMAILDMGKQKAVQEKTNPKFAARSRVIEAMREKRTERGRGKNYV